MYPLRDIFLFSILCIIFITKQISIQDSTFLFLQDIGELIFMAAVAICKRYLFSFVRTVRSGTHTGNRGKGTEWNMWLFFSETKCSCAEVTLGNILKSEALNVKSRGGGGRGDTGVGVEGTHSFVFVSFLFTHNEISWIRFPEYLK